MVTPTTADWPKPTSDDEFDSMVKDAVRARYDRRDLIRFGRRGQRQGGIDGLDQTDGKLVWQATLQTTKLVEKLELDLEKLDADGDHRPEIFVFAVGASRDRSLQLDAKRISDAREADDKCRIHLLFWEDIREEIAGRQDLLHKHFRGFDTGEEGALAREQLNELRYARTPELDLRLGHTETRGDEYERWKLELRNIGKCNVRIVSALIRWSVRGDPVRRESHGTVTTPTIAPGETGEAMLELTMNELKNANAEAGLQTPRWVQQVPVDGTAIVKATSHPYGQEGLFEIPCRRTKELLPEAAVTAMQIRSSVLRQCAQQYGAGGQVVLEIANHEPRLLVREAEWLENRGLISTTRFDGTGVAAELTSSGRDYLASHHPDWLRDEA